MAKEEIKKELLKVESIRIMRFYNPCYGSDEGNCK